MDKAADIKTINNIYQYWNVLYENQAIEKLDAFINEISSFPYPHTNNLDDWYKDAVVYSLYVDLFANNFNGLTEKLDYLQNLGVNCLWLLPVLQSPMRDAGFDISDFYKIREALLGDDENSFDNFLQHAHAKGMRVLFDIALNHTSDTHAWFVEAKKSKENKYRDYYIWSDTKEKYSKARVIFKGIETCNWEKSGGQYYFHRFFNFQPDLNYKNPEVLVQMCKVLLYWQSKGVDGFRADAVPYLWKEEGTNCENLPKTHTILKFMRAVLDYVKQGTLLLAEACQPPKEVVKYLGNGDECHAAYHFPLMPNIYMAIAKHSAKPIVQILSPDKTPAIPEHTQWFTFLRCHDELSLEKVYVTEQERAFIHDAYCHNLKWDFRQGEGISARLADLMQVDEKRILLAFSIMLTLPGTPIIYYGDEFAKFNDYAYYKKMVAQTGKDDTRFLVRGNIDWKQLEIILQDRNHIGHNVFYKLRKMLQVRNNAKIFGRGSLHFVEHSDEWLVFKRIYKDDEWLIMHNLTSKVQDVDFRAEFPNAPTVLQPYGFAWIKRNEDERKI